MNVYDETQQILKRYNIHANKNLGQNFLIDEHAISTIIENADITKDDLIIEIGPGLGVLTNRLIEKADKVIAVELDKKMVNIISERFKYKTNLEIINNDILNVDLNKLISENTDCKSVKVVANLPYYISTPIIMKLLESRLNINTITIMVQREVADRLVAKPGTKLAGAITYLVDYYAKAEAVVDVSKECFIPSPNVESKVIKLEIRTNPKIIVENETLLFDIIRKNFTQRRKTLVNVLVNYKFAKDKKEAEELLNKIGIKKDIRGESLTLEKFVEITKYVDRKPLSSNKNLNFFYKGI